MMGAEGRAVLPDEQPGGRKRRTAQPEVLVQRSYALGRQMDGPVASGFRRPLLGAGVGLDDLSSHLHRPRSQVDVVQPQREELAQAQGRLPRVGSTHLSSECR
jgi:hypothetical protein